MSKSLRALKRTIILSVMFLAPFVFTGCGSAKNAGAVAEAAKFEPADEEPKTQEPQPEGPAAETPKPEATPTPVKEEPAPVAAAPAAAPEDNRETKPVAEKPDENKKAPVKADPKKYRNKLAEETSPYLLMHAHNPVDWLPWGREALEKAKREKKVIFLSIGYSSCHWCHVMERESFLDEEIAKLMNEHFVCIKVDREERPDVDTIYMTSLHVFNQMAGTGRGGGWPLSMFLTPDGQPFFGGTYFPARDGDRGGATGFLTIIKRVQDVWKEKPDRLAEDAATLSKFVKEHLEGRKPQALEPLDARMLASLDEALAEQYDAKFGGFGYDETNPMRPKFPEPSNLLYLLRRIRDSKEEDKESAAKLRKMVEGTLDRMAMGGIRDHLGGGFHRYSTDRFWKIPHFEKMLYDNGQLATAYAEAFALTEKPAYRRIVDEMLEFVLREMTSEGGGFYSALDAESEDEEGKFYRWEKDEVQKLLSADEFDLFAGLYGLTGDPNFEEKYYAPQLEKTLAESAVKIKTKEQALEQQLTPIRQKLLAARDKRKRPLTDTKILTSWNGLMIRGFADAGRLLKQPRYIESAQKAADFILAKLRTDDGRLLRTYGQGKAKLNAYLNDYSFLTDGLIAIHQATGEKRWLDEANALTEKQIELFWDAKNGGFFFTSGDHETLLARSKEFYDGAQPSGNSVAVQNLVYLSKNSQKPEYLDYVRKTLRAASGLLKTSPAAGPRMAQGLADLLEVETK